MDDGHQYDDEFQDEVSQGLRQVQHDLKELRKDVHNNKLENHRQDREIGKLQKEMDALPTTISKEVASTLRSYGISILSSVWVLIIAIIIAYLKEVAWS